MSPRKPVILCVDDEMSILVAIRDQLQRALGPDLAVECAQSAQEALEVLDEMGGTGCENPVILSDHLMPGMRGDQLLVQVHARAPETLTVLLTGQASGEAVGNAVNHANLYRYIAKPWEEADLVLTVKAAVKSYFQRRELDAQRLLLQATNEALEGANAQLEDHARVLEAKVAERTQALEVANQELQRIAMLDGLTQVANRRRFDDHLRAEWQRCHGERMPIALILMDVDQFKLYNDAYGHVAGDECLRLVAGAMRGVLRRSTDLVARYGGEEFVLTLPNTTLDDAAEVAERIRQAIRALAIPHEQSSVGAHVTASMGVISILPDSETSLDTFVSSADQALYEAKSTGRDRIVARRVG